MLFSDFYGKLVILTKRNDITNVEIAKKIGIDKAAATARAKRNSKIKTEEIKEIENSYNINLSDVSIVKNSLKRHFDENSINKQAGLGSRIFDIQQKNNISNLQMAVLLNISEFELSDIKMGKSLPDIKILNNIKQNFEVSIDWLLYGD